MGRGERLTSSAEFRRVYSEGARVPHDALTTHVVLTAEERPARVGISATRGLGGSIERNRVKRRLRAVVRELRDEIRPGADVVVTGSRAALSESFQDMVTNLRAALARTGACR
jgi:ribonuclease P protein component